MELFALRGDFQKPSNIKALRGAKIRIYEVQPHKAILKTQTFEHFLSFEDRHFREMSFVIRARCAYKKRRYIYAKYKESLLRVL